MLPGDPQQFDVRLRRRERAVTAGCQVGPGQSTPSFPISCGRGPSRYKVALLAPDPAPDSGSDLDQCQGIEERQHLRQRMECRGERRLGSFRVDSSS